MTGKNIKRYKDKILLLLGIGLVLLVMYVSGIGCPIKYFTGLSCAGCGMSRALLCAVRLDMGEAFFYHPLFFLVPFLIVLYLIQDKIGWKRMKYVWAGAAALFLIIYVIRLVNPEDGVITFEGGRIRAVLEALIY